MKERWRLRVPVIAPVAWWVLTLLFPGLYFEIPPEDHAWLRITFEVAAAVISFSIAGLVWHTAAVAMPPEEVLLGAVFLAQGLTATFHVLSYPEMPDFLGPNGMSKAIGFWLAGQAVLAFGFLAYVLLRRARSRPDPGRLLPATPGSATRFVGAAYALALLFSLGFLAAVVRFPHLLPGVFDPGPTPGRLGVEGFFAAVLAADWLLLVPGREGGSLPTISMRTGIALRILSVFLCLSSRSALDSFNLAGHATFVVSNLCFYHGLFALRVRRPYEEVRALFRRTLEAEKLRYLGEMAAGAAQEIRSPLTASRGFTQLIERSLDPAAPAREWSRIVLGELDRIDALVDRLVLLGRPRSGRPEPNDVGRLIAEAAALAEGMEPGRVRLRLDIDDLPAVPVDPEEMKRAFHGIIANAVEAMPAGGTLRVLARPLPDGRGLRIDFSDEGVGIPPELAGRVLDPFFSTKAHRSGLGLSVADAVVRNHRGRLEIASRPGEGTTVSIILPTAQAWSPSALSLFAAAQAEARCSPLAKAQGME